MRSIPLSLGFSVMKADNFRCHYCGRRPPEVELEVDHVWPHSLGGETEALNLVTACFDCNRGKRDEPPVSLEWCPTYEEYRAWSLEATRCQYLGASAAECFATRSLENVTAARGELANIAFSRWITLTAEGKIDRQGNYLNPADEPSALACIAEQDALGPF